MISCFLVYTGYILGIYRVYTGYIGSSTIPSVLHFGFFRNTAKTDVFSNQARKKNDIFGRSRQNPRRFPCFSKNIFGRSSTLCLKTRVLEHFSRKPRQTRATSKKQRNAETRPDHSRPRPDQARPGQARPGQAGLFFVLFASDPKPLENPKATRYELLTTTDTNCHSKCACGTKRQVAFSNFHVC